MLITTQEPIKTRREIFISYSRRDKVWVDDYLRPMFDAANITFVIDEEDFKIGMPLEANIRSLIKECSHVLLVMTPDWVSGKWTAYESELAFEVEPGSNEVRILPLKLKECDVPHKIVPSLYLDISQARNRDEQFAKLLRQIGVTEDGIIAARGSVAKKRWWFLVELLTVPSARDQLEKAEAKLDKIQLSNEVLVTTKRLHDQLQDIEFPLRQLRGKLEDSSCSLDDLNWRSIRDPHSALSEKLNNLIDFSNRVQPGLVDVNFIKPLELQTRSIERAFRARDAGKMSNFLNSISGHVDHSLPRVNDRIIQLVKERRLSHLVEQLQLIYELVADVEFIEPVVEVLGRFRVTIGDLMELEKLIQEEVEDHGTFQNAEASFHLCDPDDEPTFKDICDYWELVNEFVSNLKLKARYGNLFQLSDDLTKQLSDTAVVRDDCFEESIKWTYSDFVLEMRKSFNKLDIDLLADCEKLKPRSDALKDFFNRIKSK